MTNPYQNRRGGPERSGRGFYRDTPSNRFYQRPPSHRESDREQDQYDRGYYAPRRGGVGPSRDPGALPRRGGPTFHSKPRSDDEASGRPYGRPNSGRSPHSERTELEARPSDLQERSSPSDQGQFRPRPEYATGRLVYDDRRRGASVPPVTVPEPITSGLTNQASTTNHLGGDSIGAERNSPQREPERRSGQLAVGGLSADPTRAIPGLRSSQAEASHPSSTGEGTFKEPEVAPEVSSQGVKLEAGPEIGPQPNATPSQVSPEHASEAGEDTTDKGDAPDAGGGDQRTATTVSRDTSPPVTGPFASERQTSSDATIKEESPMTAIAHEPASEASQVVPQEAPQDSPQDSRQDPLHDEIADPQRSPEPTAEVRSAPEEDPNIALPPPFREEPGPENSPPQPEPEAMIYAPGHNEFGPIEVLPRASLEALARLDASLKAAEISDGPKPFLSSSEVVDVADHRSGPVRLSGDMFPSAGGATPSTAGEGAVHIQGQGESADIHEAASWTTAVDPTPLKEESHALNEESHAPHNDHAPQNDLTSPNDVVPMQVDSPAEKTAVELVGQDGLPQTGEESAWHGGAVEEATPLLDPPPPGDTGDAGRAAKSAATASEAGAVDTDAAGTDAVGTDHVDTSMHVGAEVEPEEKMDVDSVEPMLEADPIHPMLEVDADYIFPSDESETDSVVSPQDSDLAPILEDTWLNTGVKDARQGRKSGHDLVHAKLEAFQQLVAANDGLHWFRHTTMRRKTEVKTFALPQAEYAVFETEVGPMMQYQFAQREVERARKHRRLRRVYKQYDSLWKEHCTRLDHSSGASLAVDMPTKPGARKGAPSITSNIASATSQANNHTRSNRRNANGFFGDAARTEEEFQAILASLENADAHDPNLRAIRTVAKIPDMDDNRDELLFIAWEDASRRVHDPTAFYDIECALIDENVEEEADLVRLSQGWSEDELDAFCKLYAQNPKQFGRIATALAAQGFERNSRDCVTLYYRLKKIVDFRRIADPRRGVAKSDKRGLLGFLKRNKKSHKARPKTSGLLSADTEKGGAGDSLAAAQSAPSETATPRSTKAATPEPAPKGDDLAPAAEEGDGLHAPKEDALPAPEEEDADLTDPETLREDDKMLEAAEALGALSGMLMSSKQPEAKVYRKKVTSTSYWSVGERHAFMRLFQLHGTDFAAIADGIEYKTPVQCRNFYLNRIRQDGDEDVSRGAEMDVEIDASEPTLEHGRRTESLVQERRASVPESQVSEPDGYAPGPAGQVSESVGHPAPHIIEPPVHALGQKPKSGYFIPDAAHQLVEVRSPSVAKPQTGAFAPQPTSYTGPQVQLPPLSDTSPYTHEHRRTGHPNTMQLRNLLNADTDGESSGDPGRPLSAPGSRFVTEDGGWFDNKGAGYDSSTDDEEEEYRPPQQAGSYPSGSISAANSPRQSYQHLAAHHSQVQHAPYHPGPYTGPPQAHAPPYGYPHPNAYYPPHGAPHQPQYRYEYDVNHYPSQVAQGPPAQQGLGAYPRAPLMFGDHSTKHDHPPRQE